MQILISGLGVQRESWAVHQREPAGYSRVYYILSGEVTYHDENRARRLERGRLYVFPATRPYEIAHQPSRPIECLWFHIDFFPYNMDRLLELDPAALPTLRGILDALLQEGARQNETAPLFTALVQALFFSILRYGEVHRPDEDMQRVMEYMRTHFTDEELTVGRLAERFGYSTAHLIRRFGEKAHITPHRYLTTLRLTHAAERLLAGIGVAAAAGESGYGDVKAFSKAFVKMYGVPPSRYSRFYTLLP